MRSPGYGNDFELKTEDDYQPRPQKLFCKKRDDFQLCSVSVRVTLEGKELTDTVTKNATEITVDKGALSFIMMEVNSNLLR